jgi:hypothetical protein
VRRAGNCGKLSNAADGLTTVNAVNKPKIAIDLKIPQHKKTAPRTERNAV